MWGFLSFIGLEAIFYERRWKLLSPLLQLLRITVILEPLHPRKVVFYEISCALFLQTKGMEKSGCSKNTIAFIKEVKLYRTYAVSLSLGCLVLFSFIANLNLKVEKVLCSEKMNFARLNHNFSYSNGTTA